MVAWRSPVPSVAFWMSFAASPSDNPWMRFREGKWRLNRLCSDTARVLERGHANHVRTLEDDTDASRN